MCGESGSKAIFGLFVVCDYFKIMEGDGLEAFDKIQNGMGAKCSDEWERSAVLLYVWNMPFCTLN